jgi:plastocyanin
MKKFLPIAAVVVIVGIIIAVAAGKNDNNSSTTPPPPTSSNQSAATNNSSSTTPPSSEQPSSTDKVSIHDLGFSPAGITVKKGTTVTWTNSDSVTHTVTSDSGTTMNSDNLDQGESYSVKFDTAGTFSYHCNFHSSMHGKVTVTE